MYTVYGATIKLDKIPEYGAYKVPEGQSFRVLSNYDW